MSAPFTPEQEARVRAIVAEMIGQALRGSDVRVREMTNSAAAELLANAFCGFIELPADAGSNKLRAYSEVELRLRCVELAVMLCVAAIEQDVRCDPVTTAGDLLAFINRRREGQAGTQDRERGPQARTDSWPAA